MAQDMHVLYKTFHEHHQVKHYQSFKTLETVFHQQCEVIESDDAKSSKIAIMEKPKRDEIVSSPNIPTCLCDAPDSCPI